MKNKKYLIISLILLCVISLTSCKDYEKVDADNLLYEKNIKANYIEEQQNNNDTIWIYIDKKTEEKFIVREHYYEDSAAVDSVPWTINKLYTNFGYVMSSHYLKNYKTSGHINKSYNNNFEFEYLENISIIYEFKNRADLKLKIEEFNSLLNYLNENNENCELSVEFNLKNGLYRWSEYDISTPINYTSIEDNFLESIICTYNTTQLKDFSNEEIQKTIENSNNRVYKIIDNEYIPTKFLSPKGNDFLYNSALKELLLEENYKIKDIDDGFKVIFKSGEEKLYTGDISYLQIEEDFNIQLIQKSNIEIEKQNS